MGRPKLPLMCSRCKRPPDEVRILSNRYCKDCMRQYNLEQRQARASAQGETTTKGGIIMDFDENWVYTNSHWEEYELVLHGPKNNIQHRDFDMN